MLLYYTKIAIALQDILHRIIVSRLPDVSALMEADIDEGNLAAKSSIIHLDLLVGYSLLRNK